MNTYTNILPLELPIGEEYYPAAIKLNTGRNCLEYILTAGKIEKVFLPYYICETILEPIIKNGIQYEFYPLDSGLSPLEVKICRKNEAFLYVNYFGVKDDTVKYLAEHTTNLIVDNTQAFFSLPLAGIDTFYSPRKFFGIPDGGYLFTCKKLDKDLETDVSYKRMVHLIKLLDYDMGIQKNFHSDETALSNLPVRYMSHLTQRLLSSIDYNNVKEKRISNFSIYQKALSGKNELDLSLVNNQAACFYPFLNSKPGIRQKLRENNIYTPIFWPDVIKRTSEGCFERALVQNLILLPVNQNKSTKQMELICDIVLKLC
jgi:hypothetical protein